jgi:chromosome segregation ATPase
MSGVKCASCGVELVNNLETFGDVGAELCASCFLTDDMTPRDEAISALLEDIEYNKEGLAETDAMITRLREEIEELTQHRQIYLDDIATCERQIAELEKLPERDSKQLSFIE